MAGVGGMVNGRGERGRQGNNRQTEKSERERESLSVFVFLVWLGKDYYSSSWRRVAWKL